MSSSCVTQRYGQRSKAQGCSSRYVARGVTERSVRGAVRQVRTDIPSPGDPGVSELKLICQLSTQQLPSSGRALEDAVGERVLLLLRL